MPANRPTHSRHDNLHISANPAMLRKHLSVTPERQGVVALPGLSATTTSVVVVVTLVEATRLLTSSGEATGLAVLVDWVDDPVDACVAADGLVLWVDEDDLEVLVGRVLVDPVRVEDAEIGAAASDTLLGGGAKGALVLQLIDTLVGGLAVGRTLWRRSLAATTADTDAVDDITLLSLVTLLSCQFLLPLQFHDVLHIPGGGPCLDAMGAKRGGSRSADGTCTSQLCSTKCRCCQSTITKQLS